MNVILEGLEPALRSPYHVVCERTRCIAGRTVHYHLLKHEPGYFVICRFVRDFILLPLGQVPERAMKIFEALVCGRVTPCTMADVITDLEARA